MALLLILSAGLASAEEVPVDAVPEALRFCTEKEQALTFIDFPVDGYDGDPLPGRIRYIAQSPYAEHFVKEWWLGGEEGSDLDLTLQKGKKGKPYRDWCGTMCTRAVYSMCLSYLSYDLQPGEMSRIIGKRDLSVPYDSVTRRFPGIVRVGSASIGSLDTKVNNYLEDPSYSPVMLTLTRKDGTPHAVLIVGQVGKNRYLIVDPAEKDFGGETAYVQILRLRPDHRYVADATIYWSYKDAKLKNCYQWQRLDW